MSVVTSDRYQAANPGTVRTFLAASIAGWKDYLAHPAAADAEILRRNPAMSQVQLDLSRQVLVERHLVDGDGPGEGVGSIDPKRFEHQYRILRDLDIIKRDFDYRSAFSSDFLPKS